MPERGEKGVTGEFVFVFQPEIFGHGEQFQRLVAPGQELFALPHPGQQGQVDALVTHRQRGRVGVVSQTDFFVQVQRAHHLLAPFGNLRGQVPGILCAQVVQFDEQFVLGGLGACLVVHPPRQGLASGAGEAVDDLVGQIEALEMGRL